MTTWPFGGARSNDYEGEMGLGDFRRIETTNVEFLGTGIRRSNKYMPVDELGDSP
jgi:hypothetical protein